MKTTVLLFFFLLTTLCYSQDFWEPYEIPNDMPLTGFCTTTIDDLVLFACNYGLYEAYGDDLSWFEFNTNFTDQLSDLSNLFAYWDNLYMLQDHNKLWASYQTTEGNIKFTIHELDTIENCSAELDGVSRIRDDIFVYSSHSTFNDGRSIFGVFHDKYQGWKWPDIGEKKINCISLDRYKSNGWAGTTKGLYNIVQEDDEWVLKNDSLHDSLNIEKLVTGNYFYGLFIATSGSRIYFSYDKGNRWIEFTDLGERITSINTLEDYVYCGTEKGNLFVYSLDRPEFKRMTSFPGKGPIDIIDCENGLCVAADGLYIYSYTSETWSKRNKGLTSGLFHDMVFCKNNSVLMTGARSIFAKNDAVSEWNRTDRFLLDNSDVPIVTDLNDNVFVLMDKIYVTRNTGNDWLELPFIASRFDCLLSTSDGEVYVLQYEIASFKNYLLSIDYNKNEIKQVREFDNPVNAAVSNDDAIAVIDSNDGLFISSNYGSTWANYSFNLPFTESTDFEFAFVDSILFICNQSGKVYRSSNFGATWDLLEWAYQDEGGKSPRVLFKRLADNLYVITHRGVYVYDRNKYALISLNYNVPPTYTFSLAMDRDGFLYLSNVKGVYKSRKSVTSTNEPMKTTGSDYINPNPATGISRLSLSDVKPGTAYSIKIFNSLGTEVMDLGSNTAESAAFTLDINTELLGSGAFFISFSQDGISRTIPFTVVR